MLGREAIEAYVLQLLQGVGSGPSQRDESVVFPTDEGVIFLQRGGQHFRIRVEPITLEPAP